MVRLGKEGRRGGQRRIGDRQRVRRERINIKIRKKSKEEESRILGGERIGERRERGVRGRGRR